MNEIRLAYITGQTVSVAVRNVITGPVGTYSVPEVDTGFYVANFPTAPAGTYDLVFTVSGSPVGSETIVWDGTDAESIEETNFLVAAVTSGSITLQRGDDYFSADNRAIVVPFFDVLDLTNAMVYFNVFSVTDHCKIFTASGTVTSPTNDPVLSFEIPRAQTILLYAGDPAYEYSVVATMSNGDVVTMQIGTLMVTE